MFTEGIEHERVECGSSVEVDHLRFGPFSVDSLAEGIILSGWISK
jgi:hypothetical protein